MPRVFAEPAVMKAAPVVVTEDPELKAAVKTFEASIKSCLGTHCFDEKSVKGVPTRIGLLSPDTRGINELLELVLLAGKKSNLEDKRSIEVSTHVPAYGYGKNHGWSRIIRFVTNVPEHSLKLLERHEIVPASSPDVYVLCYTSVLPSSLVVISLSTLSFTLIHLLLPACIL
jgi:hypothetical protein